MRSGALKRSTNVIRGQLSVEKVNPRTSTTYSNVARTPISDSRGMGITSYSKTSITSNGVRTSGVQQSVENYIQRASKSPIPSRRYDVSFASGLNQGGRSIIGNSGTGIVHTSRSPNISTVKDFRGTIMGTDSQLRSATFTQQSGTMVSNVSLSPSRIERSPIGTKLTGGVTGRSNFTGTVSKVEKKVMRLEDGREINQSTLDAMLRPTSRRVETRSVLQGTSDTRPIQTVGGMRTVNSGKLLLSTSTDKTRGIKVTKDIKVTSFGTTNYAPSTITGSRRSGPVVNSGNYFDRIAAERSTSRTRVSNIGGTMGGTIPAPTTRSIAQNSRTITSFPLQQTQTVNRNGSSTMNGIGNAITSGIRGRIVDNITGKSISKSIVGTGISTASILGSSLKTTPGVLGSELNVTRLDNGATLTSNPYISKTGNFVASAAVGRY